MSYGSSNYLEREARETALREAFDKFLPELAAALGLGWTVDRNWPNGEPMHKDSAVLRDAEGRGMHVHVDGWKADSRISVSGDYVSADHTLAVGWWKIDRPSITADMKRGAPAVAKDILRRFLPGYDKARAEWEARVGEATVARDNKRGRIAHFATLLGINLTGRYGDVDREMLTEYVHTGPEKCASSIGVTVHVYSSDAKLELTSCPFGLADKIVRLVKAEAAALARRGELANRKPVALAPAPSAAAAAA